jgi:hypothetical protein
VAVSDSGNKKEDRISEREFIPQTGNYESDISRVTKRKVRISRKIRHGFVASSIGCPVDDQKSVKAITAFFVI